MTLAAGSKLGPYEILGQIGAGGMGEVYRARDPRLGREVAIKVLPASFSADPDRLRRFEQEARAASALSHPNILTIYDVGTHDGVSYVVSELLEGETLRERMAGAALPTRRVIEYGVQVGHGLAAAHEKGIVHRDLKPENLFVTKDERVKILDFGLAKLNQPETVGEPPTKAPTEAAGTEPGVVMGTIGYMSPEQVRGQTVDHRSDIFSFGAILYEMLTGRRAFRGDSVADTMSAILREEPPELAGTNREIPPSLERIVRHCLEKSPQARFHAAGDVAFALEEVSGASAAAPLAAPAGHRRNRLAAIGAALAALLVIAVFGIRPLRRSLSHSAPSGAIRSIAVLPLENFSRDPEQEYFADGMTEELITDLAQIRSLRVISRTSVISYKGTKKRIPQIARELDVDAVLEGSVQRAGQRVRITAQLVRAATDQHLWAKSYERDLREVLSLQSEVAQAVAREVQAVVTPEEQARLGRARPVNPEAHEAYLKGRYSLHKQTEESIRKAIEFFNQAIAKDPGSAPAYAGLADSYSALRSVYAAPRDVMPKAKKAALKAVELDEALPEAHVSLGNVKFYYDFDWPDAEKEFQLALELNPNFADGHDAYATYLAAMERHAESAAHVERAEELDPLSLPILADAAWVFYCARQYDRAMEASRRAVELDPRFWPAYTYLGLAYEKMGRFPEAIAALEKARQLDDNTAIFEMLGGAYAASGRKDDARKVLSELTERSKQRYVCPYEVATVYVGLGEKESALQWLQKAEEDRADCVPWMRPDPKLDPLRGDPRFQDLMRRVGFPP